MVESTIDGINSVGMIRSAQINKAAVHLTWEGGGGEGVALLTLGESVSAHFHPFPHGPASYLPRPPPGTRPPISSQGARKMALASHWTGSHWILRALRRHGGSGSGGRGDGGRGGGGGGGSGSGGPDGWL